MFVTLLTTIVSTAEAIPAQEFDFSSLFFKMVILLLFVVVMGVLLLRFVGPTAKWRQKGAGSHFKLLSWYRLEPKKTVYLLQIGRPIFAIGAGDGQVNLISELHKDDLEDS